MNTQMIKHLINKNITINTNLNINTNINTNTNTNINININTNINIFTASIAGLATSHHPSVSLISPK